MCLRIPLGSIKLMNSVRIYDTADTVTVTQFRGILEASITECIPNNPSVPLLLPQNSSCRVSPAAFTPWSPP